jgi:cell division septum initiation protein DivIVA
MSNSLITEVLKIEREADNILNDARLEAERVISNIDKEVKSIKTALESEFQYKLGKLKEEIAAQQRLEEERLRNDYELPKRKFLNIDNKKKEDAINCVLKYIQAL